MTDKDHGLVCKKCGADLTKDHSIEIPYSEYGSFLGNMESKTHALADANAKKVPYDLEIQEESATCSNCGSHISIESADVC